jgi:hypothetical protein
LANFEVSFTPLHFSSQSSAILAQPSGGRRTLPSPGQRRTLPNPRASSSADNNDDDKSPTDVPDDVQPLLQRYLATTRFQYACFEQTSALDVESDSDVEV